MKIAALDIGGTNIKYCLYDTAEPFSPAILQTAPTNAANGGSSVIKTAMSVVQGLGSFDRIGISTAGQVHPQTGEILFASDNIPNYTGTKLAALFEEKFRVPTVVENDVNAAMLAETLFGLNRKDGFVIGLTYGTGIGGAIIFNGKLYRGSRFAAGEFGHMITHAGGLPCTCGKHGCYEAYASTGALIRTAEKVFHKEIDGSKLVQSYSSPEIKPIIDDWIQEVVYGLVSLVHIFNPYDIILGGGIMENDFILDAISERLVESVLPNFQHVKVRPAQLGNASGLRGAIFLAEEFSA